MRIYHFVITQTVNMEVIAEIYIFRDICKFPDIKSIILLTSTDKRYNKLRNTLQTAKYWYRSKDSDYVERQSYTIYYVKTNKHIYIDNYSFKICKINSTNDMYLSVRGNILIHFLFKTI